VEHPSPSTSSKSFQGLHPRVVAEGFDLAKDHAVAFLDSFKVAKPRIWEDRELLCSVARTSLMTKLYPEMALQMTEIVTDAVLMIRKEGEPIDLNMVREEKVASQTSTVRPLLSPPPPTII
jgi:T-complex protein 1 subunit zeta